MTSAFTQNGFCFTVSGASKALQTPYSIAKPATATAKPTQYSSAVATWLVDYLNGPDWGNCGENGSLAVHLADAATTNIVNVAVPTGLGAISRGPFLSPSSSSSSPSSTAAVTVSQSPSSSGLSTSAKAAIGVAVPVIVLAVLVPALILWFRYRKQRAALLMRERKMEGKLGTGTETESVI